MEFLESYAARKGRDVTKTINRIIADYRNDMLLDDFIEAVSMPKVLRLKTSSSTTDEVSGISRLLTSSQLSHLVFAAKESALNERTLGGYAEFSSFVVLFDGCSINHARPPRIMDVERLLKRAATSNLRGRVSIIEEPVNPTSELNPDDAWAYYKDLPTTPFDIPNFLKMLAPTQVEYTNLLNYKSDDGYCVKIERRVEYGGDELVGMVCFSHKEDAEKKYSEIFAEINETQLLKQQQTESARHIISISAYGRLPEIYQEIVCSSEFASSIR